MNAKRTATMHRLNREESREFVTLDGSTIRVLVDSWLGGARNQSLAEASLPPGNATDRHRHPLTEEIYYILAGTGVMEVDGARSPVKPGDAVLIPPGAMHQIRADADLKGELRFLCCCAPAYSDEDTIKD